MVCTLRKWKISDAPDISRALSNKKIQDNLRDGYPCPYTEKDAQKFIAAMLAAPEGSVYAFAITVEDKAVGSIAVFRKENIHCRTAEMGYYIAEPFWGQGIATSAVQQICRYIFAHTDILRIFAEPFAYNTASCRVLEKCGFSCEGLLRSNAVKNGNVIDMKLYSLLRTDTEN
jgi:ribosomal-protein-alanine N-acetyltransferase